MKGLILMEQLQSVFNYGEKEVRTLVLEGEPWFVAKDVCDILDLVKVSRSLERLSPKMKGAHTVSTPGGPQEMSIISEAGVYKLVFSSRKEEAERFTDWIAEDVLPEIRKTGQYNSQPQLPQNYEEALEQLLLTVREKRLLEEKNALMAPKAEMYDVLLNADNAQTMTEVAKCFGMGRNKLFKRLRDERILMTGGPKQNLPYQKYIDNDYFEVREVNVNQGDRTINVTQTLVTAKGIDLIGKMLKERNH